MYFLLHLGVKVQALLGPGHIVSEVVVVEVLPHVLQSVQEVAGLPEVVLQCLKCVCECLVFAVYGKALDTCLSVSRHITLPGIM